MRLKIWTRKKPTWRSLFTASADGCRSHFARGKAFSSSSVIHFFFEHYTIKCLHSQKFRGLEWSKLSKIVFNSQPLRHGCQLRCGNMPQPQAKEWTQRRTISPQIDLPSVSILRFIESKNNSWWWSKQILVLDSCTWVGTSPSIGYGLPLHLSISFRHFNIS